MAIKTAAYEQYSSSDEAPEEESFTSSAKAVIERKRAEAQSVQASHKAAKEKRRLRDQQLKTQKRKLLSQILQDINEKQESYDEEHADENKPVPVKVVARKHIKLESEKDGFRLKVVKRGTKRIPPPKSSLLKRKEQFLFR